MEDVKALIFDVLGTVVNWRHGLPAALAGRAQRTLQDATTTTTAAPLSPELRRRLERMTPTHWQEIAAEWHGVYMAYGARFMPGVHDWLDNDEMLARGLGVVLARHGLGALWTGGSTGDAGSERLAVAVDAWHGLAAWHDCSPGITALNVAGLLTCTLSNGSTALLASAARTNHIPFVLVLSADDFRRYKPDAQIYRDAIARALARLPDGKGLGPRNVAMVAAHLEDLRNAKMAGMTTIYIERPLEEALPADEVAKIKREGTFVDMWIDGQQEGILEIVKRFT